MRPGPPAAHAPALPPQNSNYGNIAALLFAFVILPAYGAASYVPSLVMGERLGGSM